MPLEILVRPSWGREDFVCVKFEPVWVPSDLLPVPGNFDTAFVVLSARDDGAAAFRDSVSGSLVDEASSDDDVELGRMIRAKLSVGPLLTDVLLGTIVQVFVAESVNGVG